jgi:glycine oxidase
VGTFRADAIPSWESRRAGHRAFFYNAYVKTWDVIVVGGGIIGLSVARELRKQGASVLVVERGEPGREASHAAGGMLANCGDETPPVLQPLATASAEMYPEFVHELEDESGIHVDLRSQGTLLFPAPGHTMERITGASPLPAPLSDLEPELTSADGTAVFLKERSVCPRALTQAALKAAKQRGVDVSSGAEVNSVDVSGGRASGVITDKSEYRAPTVVNCAGAWAGHIRPLAVATRPMKGQMVCFAMPRRELLRHVVRAPGIYLIPRSDGRLLAGATVEDVGFDKRTVPETIQRLRQAAIAMLPALEAARVLEDWAGLRPGTPDGLPILGGTTISGYFVATGHFRDGILLAPITARVMADLINGRSVGYDLAAFSMERFERAGRLKVS